MKLTLIALLAGGAAAIRAPTQIKALRFRGGAEDDDSLFGGDDAAPAGASTSMADMMNSMGGMPPGFNGACLPRPSHTARAALDRRDRPQATRRSTRRPWSSSSTRR